MSWFNILLKIGEQVKEVAASVTVLIETAAVSESISLV
jgi:hypothetical protein